MKSTRVQVAHGRLHPGLPQRPSWGTGKMAVTTVAKIAAPSTQPSQCVPLFGAAVAGGFGSARGGEARAGCGGFGSARGGEAMASGGGAARPGGDAAAGGTAPHVGQVPSVPGNHVQHLVQTLSTTARPRMAPCGTGHTRRHRFITGSSREGALTGRPINKT